MVSKARGQRARDTEFIVANDLRQYWPGSHATGKSAPGDDVAFCEPLELEVKATSTDPILAALRQAQARTRGGLPVVVWRPNGYGEAKLDEWVVAMQYRTFFERVCKDANYWGQTS